VRVNVVCRNYSEDRVLPRFSRYLAKGLGWQLTRTPDPKADLIYLSAYFEATRLKPWPNVPVMAYFTHREKEPPGNSKQQYFDKMAKQIDLRVATAKMYADFLRKNGPTIQAHPPVERDRFVIGHSHKGIVCGFSGYTYTNHRKGEDLVKGILSSGVAKQAEWKASGRGWPVPTKRYPWKDMPAFYQSLDILVVTSRVEGVPMPPLEALACGVSVVVPRGVGLLDELEQVPGIHRYKRGDLKDLIKNLGKAIELRPEVDREQLRAVTEPYTIQAWCEDHVKAVEVLMGLNAGINTDEAVELDSEEDIEDMPKIQIHDPVAQGTGSRQGIYCVAFGDPARTCALRMMKSAKKHMPEIPICLCSDRKIGPEDVLIVEPDSDIGGRRAKLKAYELSPAEWEHVLYLDADTEVVGDIRFYFQLIADGWEFVICKDPHLMDTMHSFRRSNNLAELHEIEQELYTLNTLQYNGGVWAFGRNKRVASFFARWRAEWEKHAQRDQGALIRAMYRDPLKVLVLGNEWNTFPKYTRGIQTAGLMHYPGDARRWDGMIQGRIDSKTAWQAVDRFLHKRPSRRRR